jgi:hypothetical protein
MSAQQRFFDTLKAELVKMATPDRMPLICIAGHQDFDLLKSEAKRDVNYSNAGLLEFETGEIIAQPGEPADLPTVRLDSSEVTQALPAFVNEPNVVGEFVSKSSTLDERQSASMIETFNFCGAQVFRALSMETGFIFA